MLYVISKIKQNEGREEITENKMPNEQNNHLAMFPIPNRDVI